MKFNWRKNIPRIIWAIFILALLGCVARILIWEHFYYQEKEGSERATSVSVSETTEDVDETDVTDDDKNSYVVAADRPRFLSIEKLGIDRARVLPMGLSTSNQLQTPNNIFDVGWYTESGKPGQGGTMLIDGHNGGPTKVGVFKNLPDLSFGDLITVERGDGQVFTYQVVESETLSISEANKQMSKMLQSPEEGRESLSLITCTGEWSQVQRTYLSRQFVRAVLQC